MLFSVLFFVLVPFLFYIRFPLVVVLFFAVLFFVVFGCFFRAFFRAFCGVFFVSFIVFFFVHFFVFFLIFFFRVLFFRALGGTRDKQPQYFAFWPVLFSVLFLVVTTSEDRIYTMYTKRLRDKYALQTYGGFTIRLVVEVIPVLECYLHTMKFTKHWFKDHRRFVTLAARF